MKITNLNKTYGNKKILEDITFSVREKEFFVVLGNSGSGKSTLLKIIAGIEKEEGGSIVLDGVDITDYSLKNRGIGYIFQEPLLFPHMTVKENICYSSMVRKISKKETEKKYESLAEALDLEGLDDSYPHMLSGGQKQRVSLGRSLANSPKILLMDEPFSSLDQNLRSKMGEFIKKIQKDFGLTIIFVTHDIDQALILADKIAFLDKGRIIEINEPKKIYYSPEKEETARFMGEYNKIKGRIRNKIFYCIYGEFKTTYEDTEEIEIYVRPQKIFIQKNKDGKFEINEIKSLGKLNEITLKGNDLKIHTYSIKEIERGERVQIEIEL